VTGHAPSPLVHAIFVWLNSAVIIALLACLFGSLADPAASGAIYIGTVTVSFFILAYTFVIALEVILKQQPVDPLRQSLHSGLRQGERPDGHAHAASPE
jgi:predicted lysophospholipase L1 biosynthesis ABC-type transport system permease subunit